MNTYRAAYIPDCSSIGGGLVLTSEDEMHLSTKELIKTALDEAENMGLDITADMIVIGEWSE